MRTDGVTSLELSNLSLALGFMKTASIELSLFRAIELTLVTIALVKKILLFFAMV